MSLAEETRRAVRERPWLFSALRAGVVNYAAAARTLDIEADADAVATALRRFEERLPTLETTPRDARVTLDRNLTGESSLVGTLVQAIGTDLDRPAAVTVSGDVDPGVLQHCLGCLHAVGVPVDATAAGPEALVFLVPRRSGPDALRTVEAALAGVPGPTTF